MPDPGSEASAIWKESVTTLSTMEGFQASLFSVDSKDSDIFLQFLGKFDLANAHLCSSSFIVQYNLIGSL